MIATAGSLEGLSGCLKVVRVDEALVFKHVNCFIMHYSHLSMEGYHQYLQDSSLHVFHA